MAGCPPTNRSRTAVLAILLACLSGEDIPALSARAYYPWPASGRPARAGTGVSRTPSAQCRFGHEYSGPAGADRRPP